VVKLCLEPRNAGRTANNVTADLQEDDMGDWADDLATELMRVDLDIHDDYIAKALRKVRLDTLEQAANAVAYLRWQEINPFDGRTLGHSVMAILDLRNKSHVAFAEEEADYWPNMCRDGEDI